MPGAAKIVSASPAGRAGDAAALVFEYMAATVAEETGRPPPAVVGKLPPVLQHEHRNLQAVYRPPGALLIAYRNEKAAGCVGLAPGSGRQR